MEQDLKVKKNAKGEILYRAELLGSVLKKVYALACAMNLLVNTVICLIHSIGSV